MAEIKEQLEKCGGRHIGLWPVKGYEFKESRSVTGDMFFGLALDLEHQKEMTDGRIDAWVAQIKKEIGV
jgi:flavodoxin I